MPIKDEIEALKRILKDWDELAAMPATQGRHGDYTYNVWCYPGRDYPETVFGTHLRSPIFQISQFQAKPFTPATKRLAQKRLATLTM